MNKAHEVHQVNKAGEAGSNSSERKQLMTLSSEKLRCAILDDYQNVARKFADWPRIADRVDVRIYTEHFSTEQALVAAIEDCAIVVAMRERTRFDDRLFAQLPRLKLLVSTGGRNPAIDVAAAHAHGVTVVNTGSVLTGTLEHTWALLLAAARNIPNEVANLRAGGPWQVSVGTDLADKTLGIIGLGRQGTAVARVARAFNMRIIAWSQNLSAERCAAEGAQLSGSLAELLREADFATVHLVLSARTRGLIDAAALAHMKPSAYLINTSRGPIVDQEALIETLRARRIAGAALDVYDEEPLARDHPYRRLDNLVATPHLAYVTERAYQVYFGEALEDIEAWLDGRALRIMQVPAR